MAIDSELQSKSDPILFPFSSNGLVILCQIYRWATEEWVCDLSLWGENTILQ